MPRRPPQSRPPDEQALTRSEVVVVPHGRADARRAGELRAPDVGRGVLRTQVAADQLVALVALVDGVVAVQLVLPSPSPASWALAMPTPQSMATEAAEDTMIIFFSTRFSLWVTTLRQPMPAAEEQLHGDQRVRWCISDAWDR